MKHPLKDVFDFAVEHARGRQAFEKGAKVSNHCDQPDCGHEFPHFHESGAVVVHSRPTGPMQLILVDNNGKEHLIVDSFEAYARVWVTPSSDAFAKKVAETLEVIIAKQGLPE